MNNTVITSISALVFLVIGLFIGKSNKQIEIQTVVKTNIIYLESTPQYQDDLHSRTRLKEGQVILSTNEISISIFIDDELKGYIDQDFIKTKIELEARRNGFKINESKYESDNEILYSVNVFDQDALKAFIYTTRFEFRRYVKVDSNSGKFFGLRSIFGKGNFGLQLKKDIKRTINDDLSQCMEQFCNEALKSMKNEN